MKANRQQWLILNHDLPVSASIAKFSFSHDKGIGFELVESQAGLVRARFIERLETVEEVGSPYGGVEQVSVIRYVNFEFSVTQLTSEVSLVKVIRPPVSLKAFVKLLMETFEYRATLKKLGFDLYSVYASISQDREVDRLVVSKVAVSQVPLGKYATSRIEVVSTENALAEFFANYTAPTMKVEKITISARIRHEPEFLELTSAGSIYCTRGVEFFLERTISLS